MGEEMADTIAIAVGRSNAETARDAWMHDSPRSLMPRSANAAKGAPARSDTKGTPARPKPGRTPARTGEKAASAKPAARKAPQPASTKSAPARARSSRPRRRKRHQRGWRGWVAKLGRWWETKQTPRLWLSRWLRVPGELRFVALALVAALLAVAANGVYQVIRKPTELFFPVSGELHKTPRGTWDAYAPIFRRHSTQVMTPTLLAALAQVEATGNPIARTYWRFAFVPDPFEIWRPASSAVGMYQITDGTFELARRWCIHDGKVVADGPWRDARSCWFNALYSRVIPSHAVEMTAALLDHQVAELVQRYRATGASIAARQRLATVIHLCGAGAGAGYVRRGFAFAPGQRCGSHDPRRYVAKVEAMQRVFARYESR
jgi:hypothetical protein